jgi:hypothetical protein
LSNDANNVDGPVLLSYGTVVGDERSYQRAQNPVTTLMCLGMILVVGAVAIGMVSATSRKWIRSEDMLWGSALLSLSTVSYLTLLAVRLIRPGYDSRGLAACCVIFGFVAILIGDRPFVQLFDSSWLGVLVFIQCAMWMTAVCKPSSHNLRWFLQSLGLGCAAFAGLWLARHWNVVDRPTISGQFAIFCGLALFGAGVVMGGLILLDERPHTPIQRQARRLCFQIAGVTGLVTVVVFCADVALPSLSIKDERALLLMGAAGVALWMLALLKANQTLDT